MGDYFLTVLFNGEVSNRGFLTATLLSGVASIALSSCSFSPQTTAVGVECTLRDAEGFLLTAYPASLFVILKLSNVRNLKYANFTGSLVYPMTNAGFGVFRSHVPLYVSSHVVGHVFIADTSQVFDQTFERDIGFGTLWPQGCVVYATYAFSWDIEELYTVSIAVLDHTSNVLCPKKGEITVTLQLEVQRDLQRVSARRLDEV